jgi:hypothetical protein
MNPMNTLFLTFMIPDLMRERLEGAGPEKPDRRRRRIAARRLSRRG